MGELVTEDQGGGPDEVEQLITKDLEDEISTVGGIKHLRGTSQQGMSIVTAEFYLDINVDVAAAAWSDTRTLKKAYQQADQEGMYRVVSEPARLSGVQHG